jgi:hypothetical protein
MTQSIQVLCHGLLAEAVQKVLALPKSRANW